MPATGARSRGTDGTTTDARDGDAFLAWLLAEAGLSARHYRPSALRRRLPACLRALHVCSLSDARRALRRHPNLVPAALDALLLGVTQFFRDPPVFDCLERELPSLFPPTAGRLRVWSAGCSDGAELYSVAMLLAERGALDRCDLLGTDCRPDAVTHAAAGRFAPDALGGLSADRLARFFEPVPAANPGAAPDGGGGGGASAAHRAAGQRVSRALRERVTWSRADAVAAPQPGPWHVVLCRNMGMYLQPAAAERLWRGLASVLSPGGLLVLGKAERPAGVAGLVPVGPCVYRRHGGPTP